MIQPLRAVHRRVFVSMAFVLAAVLAVGLGARRPSLRVNSPTPELPASARLLKRSDTVWHKNAIQTEFYADSNGPQQIYVVLKPAKEFSEPDLLLYWTDSQVQGKTLPAQAHLLGAFVAGKAFSLPQVADHGHNLILYSLAHQTIVDAAALERLP